MTRTYITAIVFLATAALIVTVGLVASAQAQGSGPPPLAPQSLAVVNGPNPGTVTLRWTAVPGISSYRIGRLSDDDYKAYPKTWRERLAYSDVTAISAFTLTGLLPGEKYYFIIGQHHGSGIAWSSWAELTVSGNIKPCPTDGTRATPAPVAGDYDADDDGLIEVSNLAQLNAVRYDLHGNGSVTYLPYATAFPNSIDRMGCPSTGCTGYELVADLDFDTNGNGKADKGDAYWNEGKGWYPIGDGGMSSNFNTIFDGSGHTISNLYACCDFAEMGLFGATGKSSTIQNVNLASINMTVGYFSGGLVGINGGAIRGVIVNGNVVSSGEYVGGLAGVNSGAISGSSTSIDVSGYASIGGLVGGNSGAINRGDSAAPVQGTIGESFATGDVSGDSHIGGLVGRNNGTISNSYATGDVTCDSSCGNLVGENQGTITNSQGIGTVTDSDG